MLETPAKPQTALAASVCFDFFSLSLSLVLIRQLGAARSSSPLLIGLERGDDWLKRDDSLIYETLPDVIDNHADLICNAGMNLVSFMKSRCSSSALQLFTLSDGHRSHQVVA